MIWGKDTTYQCVTTTELTMVSKVFQGEVLRTPTSPSKGCHNAEDLVLRVPHKSITGWLKKKQM